MELLTNIMLVALFATSYAVHVINDLSEIETAHERVAVAGLITFFYGLTYFFGWFVLSAFGAVTGHEFAFFSVPALSAAVIVVLINHAFDKDTLAAA